MKVSAMHEVMTKCLIMLTKRFTLSSPNSQVAGSMPNIEGIEGLLKLFFSLCKLSAPVNPTALRKAKIVYNFGLSECNRIKKGYQG